LTSTPHVASKVNRSNRGDTGVDSRSSGQWPWVIAGGVIFLLALLSNDFWSTFVILSGAELLVYALIRASRGKQAQEDQARSRPVQERPRPEPTLAELTGGKSGIRPHPSISSARTAEPAATAAASNASRSRSGGADEFYSTGPSSNPSTANYVLPKAPNGVGPGRWVPPGESVRVADVTLTEGMVYVGARLNAPNGRTAPCLINDFLPVARAGDYRSRQMGYWPSYAEASPSERRAYLTWLSEGRSDPDCDIGYVFLFFYGLERRIIVDSSKDDAAKGDWPAIVRELRRLLAIYGEKSGSFRHYAGELLSWIELDGTSSGLYEKPVPEFPRSYELPPYLRLALGQASVDRAPIPAPLALAWVRLAPEYQLRTAATRCPEEFERLFTTRYHDDLGPGLVLPKNRTKLRFVYRAASAGLIGTTVSMGFGDIPDVTALTRPIRTLMEIADRCTDRLAAYSRLRGREPSLVDSLECRVLLPAPAWPADDLARLNALIARVQGDSVTLTLRELEASLGTAGQPLTRKGVRNLVQFLADVEVGIEPNVLSGARTPKSEDDIVLFRQPVGDSKVGAGAEYQTAALTLQLGSALAKADGKFGEQEIEFLRGKINEWERLTPAERCRLHAHLQLLVADPPTLTGLKKKLEPLSMAARETIAAFMVTLAQSDGFVSPDEVKLLEKIYKALGIEPDRVFRDVHAAGAGGGRASAARGHESGIHLDVDRIAVLQQDTARVSAMLSEIFTEEVPDQDLQEPAEPAPEDQPTLLPGLDEPHCAFTRLLLTRPQWTRTELEDAAADLGLMLDGALEQINEAAFDVLDAPLCEGDDPIDVDTELLEKIEA